MSDAKRLRSEKWNNDNDNHHCIVHDLYGCNALASWYKSENVASIANKTTNRDQNECFTVILSFSNERSSDGKHQQNKDGYHCTTILFMNSNVRRTVLNAASVTKHLDLRRFVFSGT